MAFPSAAGYGNLPNGNWSPEIFSKTAQLMFRKKSVIEDITNSSYFGEIANFGDSVRIMKEPEVDVSDYKRGEVVTAQDIVDEDFTLIIDKAHKFAFKIDDIEVAMSHIDWMDLATDRASYRMKDAYDLEVLAYMSGYVYNKYTKLWTVNTAPTGTPADAGADADEWLGSRKLDRSDFVTGGAGGDSIVVGTSGTFDATPLQILNRFNRILDEANVPAEGRWVVIDPVFKEKLLDENSKLVQTDWNKGSGEGLTNGRISADKIRGFRLYETNNLPRVGTGPGTIDLNGSNANYGVIVAGHDSAVATASQINKTEKIRDVDSFADVVRGLNLFGRKILRPEALVRAAWNVNA